MIYKDLEHALAPVRRASRSDDTGLDKEPMWKERIRYGWRTDDIEAVARQLEAALGIEFEPRHSLYLGDYYSWPPFPRDKDARSRSVLQANFFEDRQELAYPQHPDHRVLLHASSLPDAWNESHPRPDRHGSPAARPPTPG